MEAATQDSILIATHEKNAYVTRQEIAALEKALSLKERQYDSIERTLKGKVKIEKYKNYALWGLGSIALICIVK